MDDPARRQAEVPYPTGLYVPGHPSLLAACARLHGLDPAAPAECRYLDLGCGDGTNTIAVAESLPGSRCLGIDIAPAAIERGGELRDAVGIDNVELEAADFRDAAPEPGAWDFVVLHGILSWVPDDARVAALDLAARSLAPNGVLMASYNALPGWWLLQPARALARRHAARAGDDPEARAGAARDALERAIAAGANNDAYRHALQLALERYAASPDNALDHDDLADVAEPLSVRDVAELSAGCGLAYVGEVHPEGWWRYRLEPEQVLTLVSSTGSEAIDRQEEADLYSGTVFNASLFAAVEAPTPSGPDWRRAEGIHLVPIAREEGPGQDAPAELRASFETLEAAAPVGLTVSELASRAGFDLETAAHCALRHCAAERAWPLLDPPRFAYPAPERPRVPKLARLMAERSGELQTLTWDTMPLDTRTAEVLIAMLDGTRDRDAIATELRARAAELGLEGIPEERLRAAIEDRLEELAQLGGIAAD